MSMDVRLQTDVNALMGKIQARYVESMLQRLQFVGERFVVNVRTKLGAPYGGPYREAMKAILTRPKVNITEATPRYMDVEGLLNSSIGFRVIQDGKVVINSFTVNGEGTVAGQAAINELTARFPSGLVLMVVAGMEYAAAVESLGYDVLTGSSFIAEKELREALKTMQN